MMLAFGETAAAVTAFSNAIKLGKEKKFKYYENSSFLYRAEAQLKLNSYKDALQDAGRLDLERDCAIAAQLYKRSAEAGYSLAYSCDYIQSDPIGLRRYKYV